MKTASGRGGNATIGIGHLVHYGAIGSTQYDANAISEEAPFLNNPITLDQVFEIFSNDLQVRADAVDNHLRSKKIGIGGNNGIDEYAKAVIVDILYNCGGKKESEAVQIYSKDTQESGRVFGDVALIRALQTGKISSISTARKNARINSARKALNNDLKKYTDADIIKSPNKNSDNNNTGNI